MPGTAAGTVSMKQSTVMRGDLFGRGAVRGRLAGEDHVRLEQHAFEGDALVVRAARRPRAGWRVVTS